MARPKLDADQKRDQRFNLRFTLAEIETVRAEAANAGLDPHEYCRALVLAYRVPSAKTNGTDSALITAINRVGNNVNQLALATHRGSGFQAYWRDVGEELRAVLNKALEGFPG